VVVVNWNTAELLRQCLEGLEAERNRAWCQVIVVDNASTDGSADMVERRFGGVELVRNDHNAGFARGVNQGYSLARAPFILLLNSDARAEPQALSACADYLDANPKVAVIGCRMSYEDGSRQKSAFRFPSLRGVLFTSLYLSQLFPDSPLWNWDRYGSGDFSEPEEVDCVMGSFFMVRAAAIETGELFDEGYFMYAEETDLCYRLKRGGWKVVYFPGAHIVHHHRGSSRTPEREAWSYEAVRRGILRFLYKCRGASTAWVANALWMVATLPRAAGWLALDCLSALRSRQRPILRRTLKARALLFHVRAFFAPGLMNQGWSGPR
jgi:GT2 family glycosyltransferase